jgi:CheY-like chemotaxis protein
MRCRARSGSFGFWHAPLAHDEKLRRVHFLARSLNKGVFDVPLRILFADDSMTAQNMGKKILSDAGYDVIAVSNGAAAVKKIAEQKPDIIILDVYMPGYSGLEVCEKVRASLDTAKTPVLLTVGKMEPYKPEDANRVKADGVIIKPFEASDLLAIVKKFEERIALMPPPPIVAQTVRLEPKYQEEEIEAPGHVEHHTSSGKSNTQPMVEVPDHMAGSSAFSDLLGPDAPNNTQHFAVNTPAAAFETSVIVPAPPVLSADYEPSGAWKEEAQTEHIATVAVEQEPEILATAVDATSEPAEMPIEASAVAESAEPDTQLIPVEAEPEPPHPQFIPVYKEPEPPPAPEPEAYEVVPTAAPPTGEMDIPREPELQETAEETTRSTVADHVEPGLLSPIEQQMETLATQAEPVESVDASPAEASIAQAASPQAASLQTPLAEVPFEVAPAVMEVTPVEVAPLESEPAPAMIEPPVMIEPPSVEPPSIEPPSIGTPAAEPQPVEATAEVSDSDFEARVAAAMAAYNHAEAAPSDTVAEAPAPVAEAVPAGNVYTAQAFEVAQRAPSFEYHPAAREPEPTSVAQTPPASAEIIAEPAAPAPAAATPPVTAPPQAEPVEAAPEVVHSAIASGVEAAAVAAASEVGSDHHNITQAIHRVMERLKPELVEEIMRELKPKK